MANHSAITKEPIFQVLYEHRKTLFLGMLFWMFNSSSTFFITVNAIEYFKSILDGNHLTSLIISSCILILIATPLPFFGFLADKLNNRKMLIWSMIGSMLLLVPLSYSVENSSLWGLSTTMIIFVLLATCNTALLPYVTSELFPTRTRYTCIGICFNITDSMVGGFTPFLVLYLTKVTKYEGSFVFVILFFAIISLISYLCMKEKHPINK